MKITIDKIKSLNPCEEGIDNFESKYPNFKGTLETILCLNDISYSDKIWLATRVLDKMTLVQWSLDCATFVVDNFNREFPDDNRVNDCLDVVQKYINGEVSESAVVSAARSVARSALSAARSAAKSAEWSARSAAWSKWSAAESAAESAALAIQSVRSATWSAALSAARSAARSAAWSGEKEQEDLNLSLLIALVSEDV